MPSDKHVLRKLASEPIVSVGTHVVVRTPEPTPGREPAKAPESVGVVVESPVTPQEPYSIQLSNGQTTTVYRSDFSLRRREVDDEIGHITEDLTDYVIYRCQVGSKAFGLATDHSDDDIRGIYLPPGRMHWSMRKLPEQLEFIEGAQDEVYWELEKFLKLALKASPNTMEILWTPLVLHADATAKELLEMRQVFLSKHLYKTYSGFVIRQLRLMSKAFEKTGEHRPKQAVHLIRVLHSGIQALETGDIMVDVGEYREELRRIRDSEISFENVKNRAAELRERLDTAFRRTTLPDQPDYHRVDEFLIRARRKMVDA
jgi:predicted nucleotidyltransferase